VNYFGYLRTIRAVLPHMRANDGGVIHNVSSGTGLAGCPGLTGYAATKGAIEAFVRSLRLELHDEDVTCTLMHPPMVAAQLSAPLGYPDWLASDPATVGRKLARQIESTDPVVMTDWQTRVGLALIRRFPSLWRVGLERLTGVGR
jgi:short-subunit dehydrogenase